jgi:Tol biopolymer transport system component
VLPASGGSRRQWTPLTSDKYWADKPRWAPDGRSVYFTYLRDSFRNVWGIRFDPDSGKPAGDPFQVTQFDSMRHQLAPRNQGAEIGVSASRLVLTISEQTGSIWMLDHVAP